MTTKKLISSKKLIRNDSGDSMLSNTKTEQEIIEESLKCLSSKLKISKRIVEEKEGYACIRNLKTILTNRKFIQVYDEWDNFAKYNYDQITIDALEYLASICNDFNLLTYDPDNYENLNDRRITNLKNLVHIVYAFTEMQFINNDIKKFVKALFENPNDLLKVLLSFFQKDQFLSKYTKHLDFQFLIISIMLILKNLSENKDLRHLIEKNFKILQDFGESCRFEELYIKELNEIQLNLKEEPIEKCLKYLKDSMSDQNSSILFDFKIYSCLLYIIKQIRLPIFNQYNLLVKYDFENFIYLFLEELIKQKEQKIDFVNLKIQMVHPAKKPNENEIIGSSFYYVITIINEIFFRPLIKQLTFSSSDESENKDALNDLDGFISAFKLNKLNKTIIGYYMKLMSDNKFLKSIRQSDYSFIYKMLYFLDGMLSHINVYKKEWIVELNIVNVMIEMSPDSLKNSEILLIDWILAYTASDDHADDTEYKNRCQNLVKTVYQRLKLNTFDNIYLNKSFKNILSLFCRLAALSPSHLPNFYKDLIFGEFGLIEEAIYIGDSNEKILALKLLIQLSFSQEIFNKILQNVHLTKYIDNMLKKLVNKNQNNEELNRVVENVSFIISNYMLSGKVTKRDVKETKASLLSNNIMISMNGSSLSLCKKIKIDLEKRGFSIINNLNTSNKNFSALKIKECIDKAKFVLICIDESYRVNEMNQLEAKYALAQNKIIIPLIMQTCFEKLSGWLEQVVSKKNTIIDYTNLKSNFTEKMDKLSKLLKSIIAGEERVMDLDKSLKLGNNKLLSRRYYYDRSIELWSSNMVNNWLERNDINSAIIQMCQLDNVDGSKLTELYMFKKSNPEFFYNQMNLEAKNPIKLSAYAHFEKCLNDLFERNY